MLAGVSSCLLKLLLPDHSPSCHQLLLLPDTTQQELDLLVEEVYRGHLSEASKVLLNCHGLLAERKEVEQEGEQEQELGCVVKIKEEEDFEDVEAGGGDLKRGRVGESEEPELDVEEILGIRVEAGVREYLVKWKGWEEERDRTWEPREHLQGAQELVRRFETEERNGRRRSEEQDANGNNDGSDDDESEGKQPAWSSVRQRKYKPEDESKRKRGPYKKRRQPIGDFGVKETSIQLTTSWVEASDTIKQDNFEAKPECYELSVNEKIVPINSGFKVMGTVRQKVLGKKRGPHKKKRRGEDGELIVVPATSNCRYF